MEAKTENRTMVLKLGGLYSTCGVKDWFDEDAMRRGAFASQCLGRYLRGDWGDLDDDDRMANDAALVDGSRILAAYHFQGRTIWIITEAEDDSGVRACTTILFPEEY